MKKRLLSLLLTFAMALTLVCITVSAENVVKDVTENRYSTYTAYYYVPGSADGAPNYITWTDTGEATRDEGNEHIQTAVKKSGVATVPKGTEAIRVGGGLGNVKVQNTGFGAKTLHCRYTFVESSSPIRMTFTYRNSSAKDAPKDTFTMTDTGVTFGDANVEATAPYDINIFQNVETGVTVIYVNDKILYDSRTTGANLFGTNASYWHRFSFMTTEDDSNLKLVIKNMHHEVYDAKFLLSDVIDYVMLDDKSQARQTDYLWTIDGIKTDWAKIQGAMDGRCTITGDNTNGYVLTPNSIDGSHYGFARYFLGHGDKKALAQSTADKVLWQSFEYSPTNLTTGQIIEIRGNDGYQTLIKAVPATETEAAYLLIDGEKVCEINSNDFYKIDLIINNKDYETYILVDGKVAWHDAIQQGRRPLWQTVFSSYAMGESMTLKNMKTTVYDKTVSVYDILKQTSTSVYTDITDSVYDQDTNELVVTAILVGDNTIFDTADLVYVAYNADGKLVDVCSAEASSEDMNTTEFSRAYPYGELNISSAAEGENLTIKAFLWDSIAGMKPISNVGQYTYTVPTTTVVE